MEQDTRPLLTTREVAARLNVSEYTVRDYLRAGRLRGIRPGGTKAGWRVSETELARFIRDAVPAERAS
jgi:excisionase family DNA binding protein